MANSDSMIQQQYTVFQENQVLTAGQLNGVTAYLEGQGRLSRVLLTGIGIVCGLEVKFAEGSITVGKGCAVTSTGDLLCYDRDMVFRFYRPFADPNAKYSLLEGGSLFELLEERGTEDADKPVGEFNGLDQRVLVLYLESYSHDPGICTGGECDNKGREQRYNLKTLLVERARVEFWPSTGASGRERFDSLPDVPIPRVQLKPDSLQNLSDLNGAFAKAFKILVDQLGAALPKFYSTIQDLLAPLYASDPSVAWVEQLLKIASDAAISSNPYTYDFLKDVVSTLSEIKATLLEDNVACMPDSGWFPRHVLLGAAAGAANSTISRYRTGFMESPVLNGKMENLRKARFLFQRLDGQFRCFQPKPAGSGVKIMPGPALRQSLSEKAIPFYYDLTQAPLNQSWSYERSRRGQNDRILSYYSARYSTRQEILAPLDFCLDTYSFFRIEGHFGMDVAEAEKALQTIIQNSNLPIRVVMLQIDRGVSAPFRPFPIRNDLKSLHYLLRRDIKAHIDNLQSFNNVVADNVSKVSPDVLPAAPEYRELASQLDRDVGDLRANVSRPFSQFILDDFEKGLQRSMEKISTLNRGIKSLSFDLKSVEKDVRGMTQASAYTPYEVMVNDSRFKWLRWIDQLIRDREDKAAEKSVFAKFLEEHPGLEHQCGVPAGGTFVLVYTQTDRRVVADFCLPCSVLESVDPETGDDGLKDEPADLIDWSRWNKFEIVEDHYNLKPFLDRQFQASDPYKALDDKVRDMDGKLRINESFVQPLYSQLINTSTSAILENLKLLGGKFTGVRTAGVEYVDPKLGTNAQSLEALKGWAEELDAKEQAGTATPEETQMRKNIDGMMGYVIRSSVEHIAQKEGDIAVTSEEAQFLATAETSAKMIKEPSSVELLNRNLEAGVKAATVGNKTLLGAQLNRMRR